MFITDCHYQELIAKVRFWGRLHKPSNNEKSHKIFYSGLMSNSELKLLWGPVISKPYQIERRLAWNSWMSTVLWVQACIKPTPEKLKDSSCLYNTGQWSTSRDYSGFDGNQFPHIYFPVTEFKRVCSGMEIWQSRSRLKTLFATLTMACFCLWIKLPQKTCDSDCTVYDILWGNNWYRDNSIVFIRVYCTSEISFSFHDTGLAINAL